MLQDAEKRSGPVLAAVRDVRITSLGRFLRATRLDETPQLINVLKGDMSLIGPRPERPEFVSMHNHGIPYYALRHLVRPGITGLAQIKGAYATDTAEKLRYDLWYIRHYSPILDLKILFRTAVVILHPSHAKGLNDSLDTETISAHIENFGSP
jgi:lipopolysaccharide/colanic/teichoic acid biosynthesis glycosyltransferase